jgi:predicted ArsR family transcriptional regulator
MQGRSDDKREDVLAQPTRARLFSRLAALDRPAGSDELAAELGLHPSGVRVHLERLRQAGLLTRERIQGPRGRPRDGWQIATDALPAQPPDAYRQLARWLARSISPRPARLRETERAGRKLGRDLAPAGVIADPQGAFGRMLTALGFAPHRTQQDRTTVTFSLRSCPYADAVRENQAVVCALHRGLTRGLLDELQPSARLVRFVPQDPDLAQCLIEVKGLLSAANQGPQ